MIFRDITNELTINKMKMTKILLLFVLCCFPILLYAQDERRPFIEEGKVWLVRVDGQHNSDLIRSYCLDGDTVIDGHPCMRLMMHDILPQGNSAYRGALREENGRVWRYAPEETAPVLLYDFTAEAGDEVVMREGELIEDDTYWGRIVYTIDHVDYVTVGDRQYKRQFVNDENGQFADVWVEGVGGLGVYFHGWTNYNYVLSCLVDGNVVFSKDDFTRTGKEAAPYHRMLAVGKKWNQSYTDRINPGNNYLFDYEIKGDTVIGGVRHFKVFSHNLDNKGEDKQLGLLLEIGRKIHCIITDKKGPILLPNTLLYDFDLEKDGRMGFYYYPSYICVLDCDNIEYNGHSLRRLGMSYESNASTAAWNPINHPLAWWVEGFGSSSDFLRPYQWEPGHYYRLESCTLNGDTLFTYADFDIPEMAAPDMQEAPYHPMLAEGKSWLYHYTLGHSDPETGEMSRTEYDVTYTLRGDTVIDGREYRKMYEEYEGKCLYHSAWREDGRKIYVAYPDSRDSLCYDYGLPYLGQAPYTYQNGLYYPAYLAAKDVIHVGGQYHTRSWFINDRYDEVSCWVDGVGCENGLIYPNHESTYYLPYWHFVSCTMPDGTVITAKDLQGKAVEYDGGIVELDATTLHLDNNRIYDLSGRVIEHPIPRHIYIKNGRKYVK